MTKTCKALNAILDEHQFIWEDARGRLSLPPPPATNECLFGVWTERSYASFMFGGAYCDVRVRIFRGVCCFVDELSEDVRNCIQRVAMFHVVRVAASLVLGKRFNGGWSN